MAYLYKAGHFHSLNPVDMWQAILLTAVKDDKAYVMRFMVGEGLEMMSDGDRYSGAFGWLCWGVARIVAET
jgi:hypothetical protein